MIKKIILGLSVAGALLSCDSKEKAALHSQVDSLRTELQASQEVEATMKEVGVLIDSIDANRKMLNTNVVEGTTYSSYTERLNSLNRFVKESQAKVAELEKSLKNSSASSASYVATIKRLKVDLESRSAQIALLEEEVQKVRTENQSLSQTVTLKDSTITAHSEIIKMRESNIAELETKAQEVANQTRLTQADLYYAEAQALETAAQRTKFAPHRKKETKKEALELYKISVSLGKSEAQNRVDELQKSL
jgi:chromosome segregation ATPase